MTVTLTEGETIFQIATGTGRTVRTAAALAGTLSQITQETTRARSQWQTAFPSRAARVFDLPIPVRFPACASFEDALLECLTIPAQCPRGGTLEIAHGAQLVSFSSCWVTSVPFQNRGVSNEFTFNLRVINPSVATLSPLAQMDARYIANLPAITALTGGTANALDALITADVGVGLTAFVLVNVGGVTQPKHFRLIAGTTAENTDPTLGALIVRPDDYHASTNAKVWVEVG